MIKKGFMAKAVCLFVNMDRTLGGYFEKGLAQMKSVVEAAPRRSEAGRHAGDRS